ncbi:MAG: Type 1 glutamine amidotransferase-like domain-containing protein [Defluviitaleaceae bacterium]|nr:Type 1 glutamine amidotransferase-like domain-containing protein [Defluviitaleaceae bacterium]
MIDSRCGLPCTGCPWKESHGCGGCIETNGNPFYGECPIAQCCQGKGLTHCGECNVMPCEELYEYSYLDPEHGDKPQGKRVENTRRWAAESGKHKWRKVLLTDSGWYSDYTEFSKRTVKQGILDRFLSMLEKPAAQTRVLFIPTAAHRFEYYPAAGACFAELLSAGIMPNNIKIHDIDGTLTLEEAMAFDVIYVTGGNTRHLLNRIKEFKFDEIIKQMVYANKVYVGASAGSLIATPNIGDPYDKEISGLCLINAYITVHCEEGTEAKTDLPLPHIPLTDNQAVEVRWDGYEIIEG